MFARFDENPAMTLRVIKETKRYGRTDGRTDARTDGRTHGQRENSIPPTNKVCGGYNYVTTCDVRHDAKQYRASQGITGTMNMQFFSMISFLNDSKFYDEERNKLS